VACFYEDGFMRFFSIKRNFKKIYKIPEDYHSNDYNFIHGVKGVYVILSAMVHAAAVLYMFSPALYGIIKVFLLACYFLLKT
jgi:hypothetical protein